MLRPELCATKLSTMNHSAAEEHLRVIRELMERATIYRAVSAPAALFCGLMALLVSGLALIPGPLQSPFQHYFVLVWVVVCVLSATANIFFLSRSHGTAPGTVCLLSVTGRPYSAIVPAFIVAIALDSFLTRAAGTELFIAVCWMALYGLALLSTMTLAPRSIVVLGWAFILTSVVILCVMTPVLVLLPTGQTWRWNQLGYFAMAGSFGLYHTIYGVIVMFSARQRRAWLILTNLIARSTRKDGLPS